MVHVIDSQTVTVNLSAHGVGTTIITEPNFGPVWDVGAHLSNRKFKKTFVHIILDSFILRLTDVL